MVKFFIDTEFIEDGKTIDLISLGVVCENGNEFYAVNRDCNYSKACDWVEDMVLNPMGMSRYGSLTRLLPAPWRDYYRLFSADVLYPLGFTSADDHITLHWQSLETPSMYPLFLSREDIAVSFMKFVHGNCNETRAEFWGYYCDYDWVVLCQLFGTMMDLPQWFPMFCLDVKQGAFLSGKALPESPKNEHHALADARWVKEAYHAIYGE